MEHRLTLDILPQPDAMTCGPTCLHAVYRYFGDEVPLEQVVSESPQLAEGGTLAVYLGCHALRRGYDATIYTFNLQMFDPTWFHPNPQPLTEKLAAQMQAKTGPKLRLASAAYLEFLERGGQVVMRDLDRSLIREFLSKQIPILTGLSSTYLYQSAREFGSSCEPDDVRGDPQGHFVVLCGYNKVERSVLVADPYEPNPLAPGQYYIVAMDRVICAILLGILTYDANLLIIQPPRSAKGESVPILIVANDPKEWPTGIEGVEVVDPRSYLTRPEYSQSRGAKLFNLCRSYRYQSIGYYVSLLAEARGHKPMPSITTIQDMKSQAMVRLVSEDLEELIQKSLSPIHSDSFVLSIYFGRNMARRYDRLCLNLFNMFQAPMLRATFSRNGKWHLKGLQAIAASEVPDAHWPFVMQVAAEHFAGKRARRPRRMQPRYDLAILVNPDETDPPSSQKAIRKFIKAGEALGISSEIISRDDYGRLAEFDALFIRETTAVNHYTYRFAQRAASEGLVVIDDPQSIVKCSNKVYLAESLTHNGIPIPKTLVVHRGNVDQIIPELGLPCVLKKPDSAFSLGVVKVETPEELDAQLKRFMEDSDLVVAQEFLPTTFDWRIGILAGRPMYACKYFMAPKHWQIIKRDGAGQREFGKFETLPIELAPTKAVRAALRAANLIGDGLYGVDVKQSSDKFYVIEVNDNPNIDSGVEDAILKDDIYRRIMAVFLQRIEQRKAGVRIA